VPVCVRHPSFLLLSPFFLLHRLFPLLLLLASSSSSPEKNEPASLQILCCKLIFCSHKTPTTTTITFLSLLLLLLHLFVTFSISLSLLFSSQLLSFAYKSKLQKCALSYFAIVEVVCLFICDSSSCLCSKTSFLVLVGTLSFLWGFAVIRSFSRGFSFLFCNLLCSLCL
jgi:hypothetical protein